MTQLEPRIVSMPSQRVAVVHTTGDPNLVGQQALQALYGSVYALKFGRKKHGGTDFKVGALRARWAGAVLDGAGHLEGAKELWQGDWALPIPDDVQTLPQKDGALAVQPATWDYGEVAQILHLGPYADEPRTVERLHRFIEQQGYEIVGEHEEEYLTRPDVKEPKTIIRYRVHKRERADGNGRA